MSSTRLCDIVSHENAGLVASAIRKGIEKAKGLVRPEPMKFPFEEERLFSLEWDFKDDFVMDPNWVFCTKHAAFSHKEACEFIIHCGNDDFAQNTVKLMVSEGCTPEFMEAYLTAKKSGAARVLFWK